MYFKDTYIDIIGANNNKLTFTDVSDTTKYKKYKLLTSFLEAPIEFRYSAKPATPNKSFKVAIGAKIGTMLAASTKGKNLLNGSGHAINNYIEKQKSKKFFNTTRMAVTARIGYGAFSLFGTYQVNSFVKDGFGPDIRPYSIGLTLSGL
ncbi:MAG: outer membrane beta-barrel protein, partial [Chitinophagaceae bacterium]|nr:outer membrane beta-barrel protein [Chitinophagaceae bacterium]